MTNTSVQWIFYDSMSKTQSNSITTEEAQLAIFKMKPKDRSRFLVWTSGWSNWQSLDLFLKSEQTYFITHFAMTTQNEKTVKQFNQENALEMNSVDEKTHKEITQSFSGVTIGEDVAHLEPELGKNQFDGDDLTSADFSKKPEINFRILIYCL